MVSSAGSKNSNEIKLAVIYFGVITVIILLASAVLGSLIQANQTPIRVVSKYASEQFGFSFFYPSNYSALDDTILRDTVLVWPTISDKNDNPFARSVSIMVDKEETGNVLDWLKSENSDHNIDYGYKKRVIGGQEAFMLYGSDGKVINWVYFDSPDHKWRISISNLPSESEVPEVKRVFEAIVESFRF